MLSKNLMMNEDGMDGEESDSCNSGVLFVGIGLWWWTTSPPMRIFTVHKQNGRSNFQQYTELARRKTNVVSRKSNIYSSFTRSLGKDIRRDRSAKDSQSDGLSNGSDDDRDNLSSAKETIVEGSDDKKISREAVDLDVGEVSGALRDLSMRNDVGCAVDLYNSSKKDGERFDDENMEADHEVESDKDAYETKGGSRMIGRMK